MDEYRAYVQESLASITKTIRKDSRSVKNRIWSIFHDAEYVQLVSEAYGLPLVSNERCGRWYIPPDKIAETVYFKSTDGHTTQWQFSIRRLNTHLLPLVQKNKGCVIVDSTRRGKRMPDALSKTVPVWCAVLNKAKFGKDLFFTPPNAVSESEHSQIEALLQQFVEQLEGIDIEIELDKPIRPIWVTPDQQLPFEPPHFEDFYPVVLCTASRMVQDGAEVRQGYTYVQGAADDHEEWAKLLSPNLLWKYATELKQLQSDEEIHEFIENKSNETVEQKPTSMTEIKPHNIWVGKEPGDMDMIIDLREKPSQSSTIKCPIKSGKLGSKTLRSNFDKLVQPALKYQKVGVVCDTGTDFSVGVVLAVICKKQNACSKPTIRKELAHIITQYPCNPSRATLNAVNSYLMS